MEIKRFYAVDGLRGLFACAVLLNHAINAVTGWKNDGPFNGPHLAVAYFFIISGFVLTHSARNGASIPSYFLNRLARLWPLTFISSVIMVIIYYVNNLNGGYVPGDYVFSIRTWVANLAFIHGSTPLSFNLINEPSWSVSIEFWASMLIPVLFLRMGPLSRLCISILAFVYLAVVSARGLGSPELFGMYNFVFASSCLLMGSGMYSIIKLKWYESFTKLPQKNVFLAMCLFVCFAGLYAQPSHTNRMDYFYMVAFLPLLTVDYMNDESLVKRFLYSAPVQFLGFISFPLYLLHFPVMITGIVEGDPFMGAVKMIAVSIVLAYLYAAFIDVKMYKYLKGRISALLPDKPSAIEKGKEA
ncbi:acyltransferase family protein [Enterobacter roggenkampii]|uniref:acyltransferase family protein n=1 Tax=Enterobacter roggenkampii TaxID=1812935 RepID=UPI001BE01CBE|nr:acyltransferase [Enterobacter roggenkampii]WCF42151.1 acyltransferase [Enterobacter roggenkampii]